MDLTKILNRTMEVGKLISATVSMDGVSFIVELGKETVVQVNDLRLWDIKGIRISREYGDSIVKPVDNNILVTFMDVNHYNKGSILLKNISGLAFVP